MKTVQQIDWTNDMTLSLFAIIFAALLVVNASLYVFARRRNQREARERASMRKSVRMLIQNAASAWTAEDD
jgi:hypothetical protein